MSHHDSVASLRAGEIADLEQLVEAITGFQKTTLAPFATPMLLFSRLDASERHLLFEPRHGRLLINESLSVRCVSPLKPDREFLVRRTRVPDPAASDVVPLEMQLRTMGGDLVATVRAGLSFVDPVFLARAKGLPSPGAAAETRVLRCEIPGISQGAVDRWQRLVGDENPIHGPRFGAVAPELGRPIVPGALLCTIIEPIVGRVSNGRLHRLSARFAAAVSIDEPISFEVFDRKPGQDAQHRAFRFHVAPTGGHVCAMADVVVNIGSESPPRLAP